ncbi:helix-turn-helix domain-containing protein [Alkalinema pantanalense CENA528]|uniref:helix-turn-helix domain-containing protein n=1 Tax=Alkalinema pantanalense TaxID=1620705 RepID=UPI003D701B15
MEEVNDQKLSPMGLRKRVGLTQQEFAQRLGKSVSTVTKWEAGQIPRWTPEEFRKVREVLGCSYEELIEAFSAATKTPEH